MQVPPTPTPFIPDPNFVIIELPDTSIWDTAPNMIQTWNSWHPYNDLFQAIFLVVLIGAIWALIHYRNEMLSDDLQ